MRHNIKNDPWALAFGRAQLRRLRELGQLDEAGEVEPVTRTYQVKGVRITAMVDGEEERLLIRRRRPPAPQPPPQPPYWEGRDVDGAHTTVLHIKRKAQFIPSEGVVFTYFQEGLWVAVVDGATEVDWAITITPGYAHGAPNEKYGDEVELELSSAARQGPQPLSVLYLDAVDPDDELSEWERRLEMLHHYQLDLPMDKFSVPRIWHPRFAAVGNTLVVALHDPRATIPSKILATAKVAGADLGAVELLLDYSV